MFEVFENCYCGEDNHGHSDEKVGDLFQFPIIKHSNVPIVLLNKSI
jgi:hypothetical protein